MVETVPASRKLQLEDAAELLQNAGKLIVMKGKKVSEFDKPSGNEEAANAMLGPTGNLRAPTIDTGSTLLVGFNESVYADIFGN